MSAMTDTSQAGRMHFSGLVESSAGRNHARSWDTSRLGGGGKVLPSVFPRESNLTQHQLWWAEEETVSEKAPGATIGDGIFFEVLARRGAPNLDSASSIVGVRLEEDKSKHPETAGLDPSAEERLNQIAAFEDDWDEDGAIAPGDDLVDRVRTLLKGWVSLVRRVYGTEILTPVVGPARDGSIDLHWKEEGFEILINVSAMEVATYYGDDFGQEKLRGQFPIDGKGIPAPIAWMMSRVSYD
ncbi:hypothetical protein [Thioalkalivibrio sp. ALJ24]|uniref:hypothetical protein n=1 Tax=Thioalkalivibrio sp. ALJ24 TaxID=545276 RepID=UPI0012E9EEC8|nr:hypothetical protein [Thioalkalivibrio sp. ALJ24]